VSDNQHTNDFVECTGHFFHQVPFVRCDASSEMFWMVDNGTSGAAMG
jgi:hypothetical protein